MPKPSGHVHSVRRPTRIFVALVALLSGCTAIKTTVHLAQAEQGLAEARNYDAQNLAVYEYTMAMRYLEKAREENGASDFRVAESLARRSAEWSDKAIISIERGRKGIDTLEDDIGELPTGPQSFEELLPEGDLEDADLDLPDAGDEFESLDDDLEIDD